MKKGSISIEFNDHGQVRTAVSGNLLLSDIMAGCQIVIAQCIAKMGITAPTKNPLLDVRNVA